MAVQLPTPGEKPWGEELNAAILGIDTDLQATKSAFDYRLDSLEAGGGGGGGGDTTGAWFAGKQWYAMGTSLTIQGFYTAPLASLSGMVLHNIGQSAQSLSATPTGGTGAMWSAMIGQTGTDAEVITMETTNDWRLSATLGTITDAEDYTVSFYGALKGACKWILTNRPAARFFLITNYNDAMPTESSWPNFYNPNHQGKFQYEYNDAVRRVAQMYGVPIIDVAEGAGLNYWTMPFYSSDGLHMNTLGGQRFAEYTWNEMKRLDWGTSRPTAPGGVVNVAVSGVTIDQGSAIALAPGGTQQLSIAVAPSNATNKGVTWSSGTPAAATVSGSGFVTAVANGTSTITVTTVDGAKTDTITVTVSTAAVSSVDVTPPTGTVIPTSTLQLTATVLPSNAGNKAVTWTSSAPSKATVNSSGLVTGVAVGSTTITCTTADGGKTDTCAITVAATLPVTAVDVLPASSGVAIGATVQLTATITPSNATNKTVTWASTNPAKATVNGSGLVTGVAAGSCNITATTADGGFVDACAITVAGSDWSLRKANTYQGLGLTGLVNDGNNDPAWSGQAWTYGGIVLNDVAAGDNAVEFTVAGGDVNGWVMVGTKTDLTQFTAFGSVNVGATMEAQPTVGGLGTNGSVTGYTLNTATGSWIVGDKFRIARTSDNVFHLWKWSGTAWTKVVETNITTQMDMAVSNPSAVAAPNIGLLTGTYYAVAKDIWTGTYMPTTYVGVTGVTLVPSTLSLSIGDASFLTVDYTPDTATNKVMSWVSSNPSVATVTAAGKVTAVAIGSTTITATSQDSGQTATCAVTVNPAGDWALLPQTTFRGVNLTGVTATASNPTYSNITSGNYGSMLVNSVGDNAIEFTIRSGSKACAFTIGGSSPAGNFLNIGDNDAQFSVIDTKSALTGGSDYQVVGGAPTPTPLSPTGWGTGVTYRIGRSGTRVMIVRVDPGPVLVTIWDGDLAANYPGLSAYYASLDLGFLCYGGPESIYTLPSNCKTGTWTPA